MASYYCLARLFFWCYCLATASTFGFFLSLLLTNCIWNLAWRYITQVPHLITRQQKKSHNSHKHSTHHFMRIFHVVMCFSCTHIILFILNAPKKIQRHLRSHHAYTFSTDLAALLLLYGSIFRLKNFMCLLHHHRPASRPFVASKIQLWHVSVTHYSPRCHNMRFTSHICPACTAFLRTRLV